VKGKLFKKDNFVYDFALWPIRYRWTPKFKKNI